VWPSKYDMAKVTARRHDRVDVFVATPRGLRDIHDNHFKPG